jgi:hypothetical protein
MFDLQTTLKWAMAVFTETDSVAQRYREAGATWQQAFLQLTLPLYVAAYLVAALLALITGGSLLIGSLSIGALLLSVLWALGWTFVIAFIFDFFSGVFDGQRGFDPAYSVVALAIVPAAAGAALAPLPWIGWLLSLAGSIYSLVLAYRFLPVFLQIPETARGKHFALSVVAAILVNLVVSFVLASTLAPQAARSPGAGVSGSDSGGPTVSGGWMGGLERQADLVDAASKDVYEPPASGKLTGGQVQAYVDVLRKTHTLEARLGESFEKMENEQPSFSDLVSGVGGAMRLGTAEMEVVKTAGGNWAEHQWVKGQLETARIQQDLNEVTAHNFRLFERYQADIERYE